MDTVTEIDAKIAQLQAERDEAVRVEEEKRHEEGVLEARGLTTQLLETLSRLDTLGFVPPRVRDALADTKGKFTPGLYIKKPRAQFAEK